MSLPGAPPFPRPLAERIDAALAARARALGSLPRFTNRLILETSPYLLQHAHNPVNWYPWGDEAFDEARRMGKPVFLSIGYSTCHWCHVMERESFEDEEIARALNELYVPIKVDREERPDIDAVYMAAVQAVTGGGGWPMSVWLTPDRQPFYGGTYFPPRDGERGASRGFLSILRGIAELYRRDPGRITVTSSSLSSAVRSVLGEGSAPAGAGLPGPEAIEEAARFARSAFDRVHGGVRSVPKFPSSLPLRSLLRHHRRTRDPDSLHIVAFTLERMAAGGIHDQLGGGFHRYSTDRRWLVPHFEKMLYDNALLSLAYAEAHQVTRREDFARVARMTLDYVLREMTSPEGGFYSATDADSEGVEGKYFVWTEEEIRRVLGSDAHRFVAYYGVTPHGNFEGANVLHVAHPDEEEWKALAGARAKLLAEREKRVPPFRDDKVLAGWNGLMISGLAFGSRVLGEPRYAQAAARAADLVLGKMRSGGRLLRVYKDDRAAIPAYLEDHAFVCQGLLDLYEATFETRWLSEALALGEETDRLFGDRDGGGWFTTGADHERLIAREKPTHDGAEPSGASVAVLNALRLSAFTLDDHWRRTAEHALRWYAPLLAGQPVALGEMLLALDFFTDVPREVVLVWPERGPRPEPFLQELQRMFLPNRAVAGAAEGPALEALARIAPVVAHKQAIGGRPTAYVCERGSCHLPVIEADALADQLKPARPLREPVVPMAP